MHNAFWAGEDLVMAMEMVEGESLKQILERGRLPVDTALDYAGQALSALEYAHAHQVTHRDITPGNMIVTASGAVKLTDFGLAKSPGDTRLTQTGDVIGSLYYMSPEQVCAEPDLDLRSDVYSMGAVLYEMVTGAKPFDGDSAFAIMSAHVGQDPPPPISVDPSLPLPLSEIILRALAKDAAERFQSAAEFRLALETVRHAPVKKAAPSTALIWALRWGMGAAALFVVAGILPTFRHPKAPVPEAPVVEARVLPLSKQEKQKPVPPTRTPSRITAGATVWAVALSPSGKWLAAGTEDRTIEIWNALTGEKHATLRGHAAGVTAVSFSRDEQSLASGGADRTARIWDLRANKQRNSFGSSGFVTAVAISGAGGWLAVGSADKKVKLWSLKQDDRSSGFREKHEPSAVAFSPDGKLVAVAGADGLKLRSVNDGREVQSFSRPGTGAIAFNLEGHCLAVRKTPQGVKLLDLAGSREVTAIASPGTVRALAVNQNGTVAIAADGAVITIIPSRDSNGAVP